MDNLGQQLKEGLITQAVQEGVEKLKDPQYRKVIFTVLGNMADTALGGVVDAIQQEEPLGEDELQDIHKEMGDVRRQACRELRSKLYSQEALETMVRQGAENSYKSYGEQFAEFETAIYQMGFSEEGTAGIMNAIHDLKQYKNPNQVVFEKLLEVAKTQGLDKALQKETRYQAIRELYPTRDVYLARNNETTEKVVKFVASIKEAASGLDSEGDLFMKTMIETVFVKTIEGAVKAAEELSKPILEQQLNEIYGPQ
ncbi:hypothetical protein HY837_05180 [archaeon]|nr:hypothetical protein [archaeon]